MNGSNNNAGHVLEENNEETTRVHQSCNSATESDNTSVELGDFLHDDEVGGQPSSEIDHEEEIIARCLAQRKMEPALKRCTKNGQTPMMVACVSGCLPVVRHLALAHGLDVNRRDSEGNTALILAAHAGHAEVIRFLLWNFEDIEVDVENNFGMTALMKSALRGHSLCARILIVAGADIEKRDWSRKYCAYEWAMLCGFKITAKAIKSVGSAGPLHIERQVTRRPQKQTKFDLARNAYSNMKKKLSNAFSGSDGELIDRAGTLYYLVDLTAQPSNVMCHMPWNKSVEQNSTACKTSTADDQQFMDVANPPTPAEDPTFRSEGPLPRTEQNSQANRSQDRPAIYCTPSSPVLLRKEKSKAKSKESADKKYTSGKAGKHLLQLPARKAKVVPKVKAQG